MASIVILDRQHAGKRATRTDHGASYDLDGDGVTGEQGEREADLTLDYGDELARLLCAAGIDVLRYGWPGYVGDYHERHAAAVRLARARPNDKCLYLALHINAGGGRYALTMYDARSVGGARAAGLIATALDAGLPEVTLGKVIGMVPTTRGWSCIDGIYAGPANLCGVLVEPGFVDAPAHRALWTQDGLGRIAGALFAGVTAALSA